VIGKHPQDMLVSPLVHTSRLDRQDKIAYGVAGVIAYDKTCEKVSPKIMNAAQEMKRTVPAEAVSAASVKLFEAFMQMGKPVWCEKVKLIIYKQG
jgi:hypothetical protein